MDPQKALLVPPEMKGAPLESLSERMFIEGSLTENRFWLRIMKEHALFLSEGFNRKDKNLIQEALKFFDLFDHLLKRAHSIPETDHAVRQLNEESIQSTYAFRNFKRNVLILIINCKISGFNLPLLVDHIAREAEYFLNTLIKFNQGILEPIQDAIILENVFWLRIMMEHSHFIAHFLDPSERNLVMTAQQFGNDFDVLLDQARDVESMLLGKKPTYPIIGKTNEESQNATMELRDFKKALLEMIKKCQIKSVINPLLADHVLREAEHYLFMINILEKRLKEKKRNKPEAADEAN
ncbi:DUF2935 domain-containing protein [Microaerobacter geothermalis]|uniref:DUF2935 domain-containing protein n=1 Tax=Microaerobacter geothermalis TaxID=674972 RepID=UPI001F432767|nr:DUF2935 domain-containing protein [Microaerobacter geothermalis]MCF6093671.1 DUF2935 domain-containing protein [Microaerobacter geothermalis]